MQATSIDELVRTTLMRDNVTEAGGEWSIYDVARVLDPECREPRSTFDTADNFPRDEYVVMARESIERILPSGGRYVGGTSGYLYSLPRS